MLRKLLTFCSLFASLAAFESSNIQYLYSNNFTGDAFIYDTVDGEKSTITFEHFRTFALGDLFMFVDITKGEKFDGVKHDIYGEIAPRFSLSKPFDADFSLGIFKDFYIATQLNAGSDYQAYLGGLGTDLEVPFFAFVSLNLYYKSDNLFDNTYQVTAAYKTLEYYGLHWEGFVDITKRDISTQNQILFNAASLFGSKEKLYIGTEWLYYNFDNEGEKSSTNLFQAMLKYQF